MELIASGGLFPLALAFDLFQRSDNRHGNASEHLVVIVQNDDELASRAERNVIPLRNDKLASVRQSNNERLEWFQVVRRTDVFNRHDLLAFVLTSRWSLINRFLEHREFAGW